MPPLACVEASAWLFSSGRAAERRQPVSVFRIIHRSLSASPGARAPSLAATMRAPSEEKASPPPTTAGMGWSPLPDMVAGMGGAEVHAHVDLKFSTMRPQHSWHCPMAPGGHGVQSEYDVEGVCGSFVERLQEVVARNGDRLNK